MIFGVRKNPQTSVFKKNNIYRILIYSAWGDLYLLFLGFRLPGSCCPWETVKERYTWVNVIIWGQLLKWWYPTNPWVFPVFLVKNDHFGGVLGVPPFKETPILHPTKEIRAMNPCVPVFFWLNLSSPQVFFWGTYPVQTKPSMVTNSIIVLFWNQGTYQSLTYLNHAKEQLKTTATLLL